MEKQRLLDHVKFTKEHFDRSTRVLKEEHSGHMPAPGMFNTAGQVVHVALTIDWFVDGATKPTGFNMDFSGQDREARSAKSLTAARKQLDASFARLTDFVKSNSQEYLDAPITAGHFMKGAPRSSIVSGIVEHTSHHRGALTVYSRTLGLVPIMPYMEPQPA